MLTPHINKVQLKNYISGSMTPEEMAGFYAHISECTLCAGKLASAMQEKALIYTPPGLKESILNQTVYKGGITSNIKLLSFNSRKKRNEFLLYTAKIAFAVSIAVSVIMTTALPGSGAAGYKNRGFLITKEIIEKDRRNNSRILDLFRSTSDKISEDVSKVLNLD